MSNLWTPWRLAYIVADKGAAAGCLFCDALASRDDAATLVVHRGPRAFVILNRYPYNNGHVMVAPNDHVGRLSEAPDESLDEVMRLAAVVEAHLAAIYRPAGFNLGMNIG